MSYIDVEILLHVHFVFNLYWLFWRFSFDWTALLGSGPLYLIYGSWVLFAVYWFISAINTKRPAKIENSGERLGRAILMIIAFILLNRSASLPFKWLNREFVSEALWSVWLGAALTLAGVLFAIWARRTIGRNWSAQVQIKEGHRLIRSGPYARIRHPIYTGILLAVAGTALAIGEYRALVALAIMWIGFARKAKQEESFLASQFGAAFEEHRRHTGFFLPRFP
jgi:protein-S-isoprenylcysteine O-methyltransferase Ste14